MKQPHAHSPKPQPAFTLLELLAATMMGAIVILMIAGSLRGAVRTWESVQVRVGENYNRRMVLDLVRRQTSSLFFRNDMDELNSAGGVNPEPRNPRVRVREQNRNRPMPGQDRPNLGRPNNMLPEGASFFTGNVQELNFLSTTSFLSDFPGQVAVRYFVVQGQPEGDGSLTSLATSRSDEMFGFGAPDVDMELQVATELEGDLYLYVEERNLFLNTIGVDSGDPFASGEASSRNGMPTLGGTGMDSEADSGTIVSTQAMRLLGPLRKFTIRYRQPQTRDNADQEDTAEDWAETWSVENQGIYPTAVEFILVYEKPGITDNVPTEELPGIRMVLPIYDSRNLARRNPRGPF